MIQSGDLGRTILFGVTSSESLILMGSIPDSLVERGWEVHIVANLKQLGLKRTTPGLTYHHIGMSRKVSIFRDLTNLIEWVVLLRRLKPQIVSIGTPKAALLGLLAAWVAGVPSRIYHLRGLRLETVNNPARKILVFAEHITSRCSTEILAVSDSLREVYVRTGLNSGRNVEVIGAGSSHGIMLNRYSPLKSPLALQELERLGYLRNLPTIGFVGRFSKDKGARHLLMASRHLSAKGLRHQVLVMGRVENSARLLGLLELEAASVIATGYVENPQDFYPFMDFLLLPSLREGFPNVVLEAGACSVPTIAFDVTGSRDAIVHGQTGLLAKAASPWLLYEYAYDMLSDERKRQMLGETAQLWVRTNFEETDLARKFTDFYVTRGN